MLKKDSTKPLLSICIPTYCRANMIAVGVPLLEKVVQRENVEIIISDNCSPDNTEEVARQLQTQYDNIRYFKQETNVGPDANAYKSTQVAKGTYKIIMGDSYIFSKNEFKIIVNMLKKATYDAIILNMRDRVQLKSREYSDPDSFLHDLGWHITLTCSIIFRDYILTASNFKDYSDTSFSHHMVLMDYFCSAQNPKVYFYAHESIVVEGLPAKTNDSFPTSLKVFGERWTSAILRLPDSISMETKRKCILDHAMNTGLFTKDYFKRLALKKYIDDHSIIRYKNIFDLFSPTPYTSVLRIINNTRYLYYYELSKLYSKFLAYALLKILMYGIPKTRDYYSNKMDKTIKKIYTLVN